MAEENYIYIAIGVMICIMLVIDWLRKQLHKGRRSSEQWIFSEAFEEAKRKIGPHCSEEEFMQFMTFLKKYGGGYVRRRNHEIVYQDYLGKEKGDLKGIFYHVVIPNPNLSTVEKEEFRKYLLSIGVRDVDQRPQYALRDSRLRNTKTEHAEYERKQVGNQGEQLVRNILAGLQTERYGVINGAVLRYGNQTKEYDHIVVGENGISASRNKIRSVN